MSAADPQRPRPVHAARPLWRRLASAQESGLVLVIALMMLVLTVFGGTKQASVRIDIPKGATSTVEPLPAPPGASAAEPEGETLIVRRPSGAESRYTTRGSWRLREQEDGSTAAFGSQRVSKFLNKDNLVNLTTSASYIAVMAVGMTAIIILAGIDLSIGSIYALAALLGAQALNRLGPEAHAGSMLALGALVCCGSGALLGFVNGFASVALRVHPFVITLGTMAVYRGVVLVQSQGMTVGLQSDALQQKIIKAEMGGVYPVPTLIMLAVAGAGLFMLARTVAGRQVYAIGGNETAARYAGIAVGRVKVVMYTLLGALTGLAGLMYLGYYGAAENGAGQGYELRVIAAAVIGGASLSGGKGSAIGAVLGAILVQLIDNGLVILEINQNFYQIVMGAAIILAVVVDQTKGRVLK